MAEIKNSFLTSKMNQDLDDRLIPNGEYRYASNISVGKSNSADVGTVQTVLGNEKLMDFNVLVGIDPIACLLDGSCLSCIGYFVDTANSRVFLFLTNYADTTLNGQYSTTAANYIYLYNSLTNTYTKLVEGPFLNFSKNSPIIGVNLLEDLLFWTDNRNQPRKININRANPTNLTTPTYYTTEDQISVAKLSPVYAIDLYAESVLDPGEYETTIKDVVSIKLPDGTTNNPYYDSTYIGDPSYLEDKMVRFSYRYKFEDNEYSIIAPFTQIAYIPKQDGYFLYEANPTPGEEPLVDDQTAAYRSTVVSFMYNKANNIVLKIKLPGLATDLSNDFKISDIEILYKESSGLAIEVVDTIPVSAIITNSVGDIYSYNYQSKKPFKTLPERDLLRVYDKTPVKAFGQEVISNRIVYSNYQDKQSYPRYLNYNVGFKNKSDFDLLTNRTSIIEFPNHSLKQNRNYQVGVVLGDRFGRQSGVILSEAVSSFDPTVGGSTLYVPYRAPSANLSGWPGYALNILFNDPIDGTGVDSWPGLYNGDPTDPDYNPLGWYYYKIVVKQPEQDYYNVYLPGVMAAYPISDTKELNKTSHCVLISDNINKVPRDLTEISSTQEQYRSNVRVYFRASNVVSAWGTQPYYPGNSSSLVNTIATVDSLFSVSTIPDDSATTGYNQFYQVTSSPLIARLNTVDKIGITYLEGNGGVTPWDQQNTIKLAVCETEPVESRLDIYWETSTAGIIEELNIGIAEESDSVFSLKNWNFSLNEAAAIGDVVSADFYFADINDVIVPVDIGDINFVVKNGNGDIVTTRFALVASLLVPGEFSIVTNDYFYFGYNALTEDTFEFRFTVTSGSPPAPILFIRDNNGLGNVAPTILNKLVGTVPEVYPIYAPDIVHDYNVVNGSNPAGGNSTIELTWSLIQKVEAYPGAGYYVTPPTPAYTINPSNELVRITDVTSGERWELNVKVFDAGGLFDQDNFTILYIPTPP
jgi:hypothetical protein